MKFCEISLPSFTYSTCNTYYKYSVIMHLYNSIYLCCSKRSESYIQDCTKCCLVAPQASVYTIHHFLITLSCLVIGLGSDWNLLGYSKPCISTAPRCISESLLWCHQNRKMTEKLKECLSVHLSFCVNESLDPDHSWNKSVH